MQEVMEGGGSLGVGGIGAMVTEDPRGQEGGRGQGAEARGAAPSCVVLDAGLRVRATLGLALVRCPCEGRRERPAPSGGTCSATDGPGRLGLGLIGGDAMHRCGPWHREGGA